MLNFRMFIETFNWVCMQTIPFFGIVLMTYLIILVHNAIKCVKNATKALDETYIKLRMLDAPLGTITNICHSVDVVHETSKEVAKDASVFLSKNFGKIKNFFLNLFNYFKSKNNKTQS